VDLYDLRIRRPRGFDDDQEEAVRQQVGVDCVCGIVGAEATFFAVGVGIYVRGSMARQIDAAV
jgi:hypothetical protein